jgi:hypothetical protein
MGAMVEEVEENWRAREDSLEFAVLEAAMEVARVRNENLCMRKGAEKEGGSSLICWGR